MIYNILIIDKINHMPRKRGSGNDPTSYLSGHSPVELAARHGQNKVIQVLLSYGAKYDDKGIHLIKILNGLLIYPFFCEGYD